MTEIEDAQKIIIYLIQKVTLETKISLKVNDLVCTIEQIPGQKYE